MLPETFCCVRLFECEWLTPKSAKNLFIFVLQDYGSNKKAKALPQRKIRSTSDTEITKRKCLCAHESRASDKLYHKA